MASQRSRKLKEKPQLQKENKRLLREIEDLEAALLLHQSLQSRDRNSIQGLIRQEVGGSRWQHGSAGKLRTYKSNQDLASKGQESRPQSGRHPRLTCTSRTQQDPPKLPARMTSQASSVSGKRPSSGKKVSSRPSNSGEPESSVLFSSTMEIENLKDKILQRASAKVIQRPSPQVKDKNASRPPKGKPSEHSSKVTSGGTGPEVKDNLQKLTYTVDKKAALNLTLGSKSGNEKSGKNSLLDAKRKAEPRRNSLTGINDDLNAGSRCKPGHKFVEQEGPSIRKNHKEMLNNQKDELSRLQTGSENRRPNKPRSVDRQSVGPSEHHGGSGLGSGKGDGRGPSSKTSSAKPRPESAKVPLPRGEASRSKPPARPVSAKGQPPKHPSLSRLARAGQKDLKGTFVVQDSRPARGRQTRGASSVHRSLSSDEDEEIARACRGSGEGFGSDEYLYQDEVPHPPAPKQPPPQFGGGHSSLFSGAGTKFEYNPNIRKSVLDQVEDILHPQYDSDGLESGRTQSTEHDQLQLQVVPFEASSDGDDDDHLLSQSYLHSRKTSNERFLDEQSHSMGVSSHYGTSSQKSKPAALVPSLALSQDAVQVFDEAVDSWLGSLDLKNDDKYRRIFAKHEIEKDDLKYLTRDQLQQMGVDAVGSLNKILKGIENLWLEDVKEKEKPKPAAPDYDPFSVGIWANTQENGENGTNTGTKSKTKGSRPGDQAHSKHSNSASKVSAFTKLKMVSPESPSETGSEFLTEQQGPARLPMDPDGKQHRVDSRTYTKHSNSSQHDAANEKPPQPRAGHGKGRDGVQGGSKHSPSRRSPMGSRSKQDEDPRGRRDRVTASPSISHVRSNSAGRKTTEERPKSGSKGGSRPSSAKSGLPPSSCYNAFARHPVSEDRGSEGSQKAMERHKQQRNKMAAKHQEREKKKQEGPKDYDEMCLAAEREMSEDWVQESAATCPDRNPPAAIRGWATTTPDFPEVEPEIESLVAMSSFTRSHLHQLDGGAGTQPQNALHSQTHGGPSGDSQTLSGYARKGEISGTGTQTSQNFWSDSRDDGGIGTQTSVNFSRGGRETSATQMSGSFMRKEEAATQMSRSFLRDEHIGTQTSTIFPRHADVPSIGTQTSVDYSQRPQDSQVTTQTSTVFHRLPLESVAGTQTSLDFSLPGRISNQTDLRQLIRSLKRQTGVERLSLDVVRDLQLQLLSLESELVADIGPLPPPVPEELHSPVTAGDHNHRDSPYLSGPHSGSAPDQRSSSAVMDRSKVNNASQGSGKPSKLNTVTFDLALGEGSGVEEGPRLAGVKERPGRGQATVASMSMSKRELLNSIRKEKDEHRKQVRHLQGELSRLQHHDPVRKSELDIRDISFKETDLIGEGAFSQVFRGFYQGAEIAIKQLKVPLSAQDKNYFAAEVSLLRELRHPRVVLLLGVCTSEWLPLMLLEYLTKGNLFSLLHNPNRESLDHVEYYQIARDMAAGMLYLHGHRPPILHLDLKSANVLIGSGHRAKIADFGFSKLKLNAESKTCKVKENIQGSPAWMAPEMLQGGDISPKADVYSFGIILWEMLTRKHPYEGCSVFQILERVRQKKRPEVPESCPQELSSFIQSCWDHNPARRPVFKDILPMLENQSFPPDWRALFQAAGVPREALENIESTRNIISLVTSTLEASQLQEMLEQMPSAPDSQRSESDVAIATTHDVRSEQGQVTLVATSDQGEAVRSSSEHTHLGDSSLYEKQENVPSSADRDLAALDSASKVKPGSSKASSSRGLGMLSGSSLTRSGTSLRSGDLKMSDVLEEDEEEAMDEDGEDETTSDEDVDEEIEDVSEDSDSFSLSDSHDSEDSDGSADHLSKVVKPQISGEEPAVSGQHSQRSAESRNSLRSSREAWNAGPISVEVAPAASSTENGAQSETALILTDSLCGRLDASDNSLSNRTPNLSARQRRSARQGGNSAPHKRQPPPPAPPLPEDGAPPPPPPLLITPMSLAPMHSHVEPKVTKVTGPVITSQELQAVGRGLQKAKAGGQRGGRGGGGGRAAGRSQGLVQFSVDASMLMQQRQQLKPTEHPHPNQLHDLQFLNRETLASIAGLLKKAMDDRRFAMGETSVSVENTAHSDLTWSFQED